VIEDEKHALYALREVAELILFGLFRGHPQFQTDISNLPPQLLKQPFH
jgi:hypothetical protein